MSSLAEQMREKALPVVPEIYRAVERVHCTTILLGNFGDQFAISR
ncbi:MAG: hypothetical protein WB817_13100 [Terriglobales bacterium]